MAASRAFNLNAALNIQGPLGTKGVISQLKREFSGIKADIKVGISNTTSQRISAVNRELAQLKTNLEAIERSAKGTATALAAISAANSKNSSTASAAAGSQAKLKKELQGTAKAAHLSATEMEEFGRVSGLAIRRFAGFTIASTSLLAISGAITAATKDAIDFQRELVRIGQATDTSVRGLKTLNDEIGRLSTNFGVSSAELLNAARILAQAGLSATETRQALQALAKSDLSPTFNSIEETTEGVIAAMRQFNLTAQDVEAALGSINEVSAKYAVESEDIIQAIRRTGGVFAAAAGDIQSGQQSLNEFVALFTSVRATTRESAESIATGLRTIFTRLQRKDTLEALDAIGVELLDLEGKFIGPYKAVIELNRVLSQIDTRDPLFSQITEELGGFRQIGKTIPLIKQAALAQEAYQVAVKGTASLDEDAQQAQEALAVQYEKTRQKFLEMIREITETDSFVNVAQGLLKIADAFIQVGNAIKPVIPLIGAFAAFKAVQTVSQFSIGFLKGVKSNGGASGLGQRLGGGNIENTISAQAIATRANTQAITNSTQAEVADTRNKNTVLSANTKAIIELTAAIRGLQLGGPAGLLAPRRRASGGHIHGGRSRFASGGAARYGLPFVKSNKVRVGKASPDYIRTGSTKESNRFGIPNTFGAAFLRSPSGSIGDIPRQSAGSVQVVNPVNKQKSNYRYNLIAGYLSQAMSDTLESGIVGEVVGGIKRQADYIGNTLGVTERTPIDQKFLKNINIDNVSGNIFEGILSSLGSPYDANRSSNATFDFPTGLGSKLGAAFNIPAKIITDARNTGSRESFIGINKKIAALIQSRANARALTGKNAPSVAGLGDAIKVSKLEPGSAFSGRSGRDRLISTLATSLGKTKSAITENLQAMFGDNLVVTKKGQPIPVGHPAYRPGATLNEDYYVIKDNTVDTSFFKQFGGEFSSGIPALTEPGELVFGPRAAQQAGYNALARFNQTGDASSLGAFDPRDVYRVPGSGRGDSYASDIPEGSFVIRRDSAEDADFGGVRKLPKRFSKGGGVSRFQAGGQAGNFANLNRVLTLLAENMQKAGATAFELNKGLQAAKISLENIPRGTSRKEAIDTATSSAKQTVLSLRRAQRQGRPIPVQDPLDFRVDATRRSQDAANRARGGSRRRQDSSDAATTVALEAVRGAANDRAMAAKLAKEQNTLTNLFRTYGNTIGVSRRAAETYTKALQSGVTHQVALNRANAQAATEMKAIRSRANGGIFSGLSFGFGRNKTPLNMSEEAVASRQQRIDVRNQRLAMAGTAAALVSTQLGSFIPQDNAYGAAAAGGLTGATTGFALGSSAGPVGAVLGAAGGAALGMIESFRAASDEISRNQLTKALDDLSKSIIDYSNGIGSLSKVQEDFRNTLDKNNARSSVLATTDNLFNQNTILSAITTNALTGGFATVGALTDSLGISSFGTLADKNTNRADLVAAADSKVGGVSFGVNQVGAALGIDFFEKALADARTSAVSDEAQLRVENISDTVKQVQAFVTAQVEAGKTFEQAMKDTGLTTEEIVKLFGQANAEAQEAFINTGDLSAITNAGEEAAQTLQKQVQATIDLKKYQDELNAAFADAQVNVDTLALRLRDMNVAVAEAGNATVQFQNKLADLASGQGQVRANQLLDIQNVRALDAGQISNRINNLRNFTGDAGGLSEAESLIQQSKAFEKVGIQVLKDAIASESIAGTGASEFFANLENNPAFKGFDPRLIDALKAAVDKQSQGRQNDLAEFGKLLNNPDFANQLISPITQEAIDLINNSVAQANKALGEFADALNTNVQQQLEVASLQDSIYEANISSANRIRELRGENISADELRRQRLGVAVAATNRAGIAGGTVDPRVILESIRALRKDREALLNQPASEGQLTKLADNTRRLGELNKAMNTLAGDIKELSAIEREISDIERQKQGIGDLSDLAARAALGDVNARNRIGGAQLALKRAQAGLVPQSLDELDALKDALTLFGNAIPEDKRKVLESIVRDRTARVAAAGAARTPEEFKELLKFFSGEGLDKRKDELVGKAEGFEKARIDALNAQHAAAMDVLLATGREAVAMIRVAGTELRAALGGPRPAPPVRGGGGFGGFLRGGFIDGAFRGNRDSELIMAQPGEFVVNRKDAMKNAALLKRINSGQRVGLPGFQNGGTVGGGSTIVMNGGGQMNLGAPSLQALNNFASSSAQLGVALGNLSNLTTVSQNLNNALQQMANINIPSRIEITSAPIQVNVVLNGAEALAAAGPAFEQMVADKINQAISKTVNPITGETKEAVGQRIIR